jgi:DNA-binding response OmpR family regulator
VPRVLVVEDEPKMLRILQRNLAAEGYDVAPEGLASLARGGFDAVILVWMLPGRDGRIELDSTPGRGTTCVVTLPKTAGD